jgi:hypothetical protein
MRYERVVEGADPYKAMSLIIAVKRAPLAISFGPFLDCTRKGRLAFLFASFSFE